MGLAARPAPPPTAETVAHPYMAGVPIRNVWLLLLYASDLFALRREGAVRIEDAPDDIPALVAEILHAQVEHRLQRNLSYGYRHEEGVLHRVRGRINLLATERRRLFECGKVACGYDTLTCDTPRNRYVRAALLHMAHVLGVCPDAVRRGASRERAEALVRQCRALAHTMERMGVAATCPSHKEILAERFGRHDMRDRSMVAAARLAFDLQLPTEERGGQWLGVPDREALRLSRLFEKAVAGFYRAVLSPQGWQVETGRHVQWPCAQSSPGLAAILPRMETDITLTCGDRRWIIDTKSNGLLVRGQFGQSTLRSPYLYQIYTYVRAQERPEDPLSYSSSGLLLHPAITAMYDEQTVIQGHTFRFATVDLTAPPSDIRCQLLRVVGVPCS